MSHDTTHFHEEELTSEYGISSSYCSSIQSEPLDLSMKDWFGDGVESPFKELVSFTNFTLSFHKRSLHERILLSKDVKKLCI